MSGLVLDEVVTAMASPNIAFIKYWGKRDDKLILPMNSSLSMTLDEQLNTVTSVVFSKSFDKDNFYLDGVLQDLSNNDVKERFEIVSMMRKRANIDAHMLVVSKNSFPTASGLASSASGICALVFACSKALDLRLNRKEMSMIARQGSGSACRSIYGGLVMWKRGRKDDGTDSFAKQIIKEKMWPDLIDIVAIVSKEKKKVSSRAGMKQTVQTSELYKLRPKIAEKNLKELIQHIKSRDFANAGVIIMKDSMSMHSVMLDTRPSIMYLNDTSREIIYAIEELNANEKKTIAAYTFDAGPNANIITLEEHKEKVLSDLKEIGGIEKILIARLGSGPKILDNSQALIDPKALTPKLN